MRRIPLLLLVIAAACTTARAPECEFDLSVNGFVTELTHARATQRTVAFDDYTPGSYHVDVATLLEGVRADRGRTPAIRALLVVGPFGPLSQYNVALFLDDGETMRVNLLAMAHARITWKATRPMTGDELEKVATTLSLATGPADDAGEASILFATWNAGGETVRTSGVNLDHAHPESVARALSAIDELSESATTTYSTDLGDEMEIFRCSRSP